MNRPGKPEAESLLSRIRAAVQTLPARVSERLQESRLLARRPVLGIYVAKIWLLVVLLIVHALFMLLLLEPIVRWQYPPPRKPTGLRALFSKTPRGPPPHERVLGWLEPALWLAGWGVLGVLAVRRMRPALDEARSRSRAAEADADRLLGERDFARTVLHLEAACELAVEPGRREALRTRIEAVRQEASRTPAPTPDGRAAIGPGGRIVLERRLGAGAMGVVHLARDDLLGRPLAVKVLSPELGSGPEFSERFVREARALARLSHPGIVQIHDLIEEEGRLFLCMEFFEGAELAEVLRRDGPLPVERAARVGRSIASALEYAHGRGVVHRDLKPANVLLGADDSVKVADFGLARLADSSATRTGAIFGSPAYMSPEQATGAHVDARADLYSLGVLLYELVAGEPPFSGDPASVIAQQLHREPPALRVPGGQDAGALGSLVARLLQKDPGQRPASAAEVAVELQAIASGGV